MQWCQTTSTYVGRHNVRPSLPVLRGGLSDSDALSVFNNLSVEDSQLWTLLQSVLLSKAGVGEVGVWLDVRFSKHSWWVHGDAWRVGCMVKRDRPIGATRGGHTLQLFFLLASGTLIAHPYTVQHLLLSHPSWRQIQRTNCYLNLTFRNTQTIQYTRYKRRQYTR